MSIFIAALQVATILIGIAVFRELKEKIMATQAEFQAGFVKIDNATTALASRIEALVASLKSGLSPAEEAEVLQQLEAMVPVLENMAVNATDPVPVEVPPEPTP